MILVSGMKKMMTRIVKTKFDLSYACWPTQVMESISWMVYFKKIFLNYLMDS